MKIVWDCFCLSQTNKTNNFDYLSSLEIKADLPHAVYNFALHFQSKYVGFWALDDKKAIISKTNKFSEASLSVQKGSFGIRKVRIKFLRKGNHEGGHSNRNM